MELRVEVLYDELCIANSIASGWLDITDMELLDRVGMNMIDRLLCEAMDLSMRRMSLARANMIPENDLALEYNAAALSLVLRMEGAPSTTIASALQFVLVLGKSCSPMALAQHGDDLILTLANMIASDPLDGHMGVVSAALRNFIRHVDASILGCDSMTCHMSLWNWIAERMSVDLIKQPLHSIVVALADKALRVGNPPQDDNEVRFIGNLAQLVQKKYDKSPPGSADHAIYRALHRRMVECTKPSGIDSAPPLCDVATLRSFLLTICSEEEANTASLRGMLLEEEERRRQLEAALGALSYDIASIDRSFMNILPASCVSSIQDAVHRFVADGD